MKTADTISTSTQHYQSRTEQPFFHKEAGDRTFFSGAKPGVQKKPFFDYTQPVDSGIQTIQTKLTIGQPGDKYEVEADAMADQVVQKLSNPGVKESTSPNFIQPKCEPCKITNSETAIQKKEESEEVQIEDDVIQEKPTVENADQTQADIETQPAVETFDSMDALSSNIAEPSNLTVVARPTIQVKCDECKSEETEEELQEKPEIQKKPIFESTGDPDDENINLKAYDSPPVSTTTYLQSQLNSSKGRGQPLGTNTKSSMESAFGADFNGVNVHTDREAVEMNKSLGAQAFTHGNDIYFDEGKYNPATTSGKHLLAHELTHTVQQRDGSFQISKQQASHQVAPTLDDHYRTLRGKIQSARDAGFILTQFLDQITLQIVIRNDRTDFFEVGNDSIRAFPSFLSMTRRGFYLVKWTNSGTASISDAIDLETGGTVVANQTISVGPVAGAREAVALRRGRIGAIYVTESFDRSQHQPTGGLPDPDQIKFPITNYQELDENEARRFRQLYPSRRMVILGLTGGTYEPGSNYGHPLDFKYYTHNGSNALLSREFVGREFFFEVPIRAISEFSRFYPIQYAGQAALPAAILSQMIVEIGMTFIPVVGPLWALALTARDVHHAYHNWDNMSGFEKSVVGLTVLLSAIPVAGTVSRGVRGARAYRQGVRSLMTSGLSRGEARRLMVAGGIFQSERHTRRIVATLDQAMRQGHRLNPSQIAQLENLFHRMLQRLPAAERNLITASFATRNLETAQGFWRGVELTERHLAGLRRLAPEIGAALQRISRSQPQLVERIALMAARSEEVARGINQLESVVRPVHLGRIASELGDDILRQIGTGAINISDELASFVRRGSGWRTAYRRLIRGRQGRNPIPGLTRSLVQNRSASLSPDLVAIQNAFDAFYLTTAQLAGLNRLTSEVRTALLSGTDMEVRAIATMAARSSHTSNAINNLSSSFLQAGVRSNRLSTLLSPLDEGALHLLGQSGIQLNSALISNVARQLSRHRTIRARNILLRGFRPRGSTTRISGIMDSVAATIPNLTSLESALTRVSSLSEASELFTRWALRNPTVIEGIETIVRLRPTDATDKIRGIYHAFSADLSTVRDVIGSLRQIERNSSNVTGLDRMIAELAAGGTKTMGASLTLDYAIRRYGGVISAFERTRRAAGGLRRDFDLVVRGIDHEFKFWTRFTGSGRIARQAASEFERDLILHLSSNLRNLRWVISRDVATSQTLVEHMMRRVMARPSPRLRRFLRQQNMSLSQAQDILDTALANWLLEFF